MRFLIGFLAFIGLAVVLVFLAAIGLFAYDELRRKLFGDEFETPAPVSAPGGGQEAKSESGD